MFEEVASLMVLVTNASRYLSPTLRSAGIVMGAANDARGAKLIRGGLVRATTRVMKSGRLPGNSETARTEFGSLHSYLTPGSRKRGRGGLYWSGPYSAGRTLLSVSLFPRSFFG